MKLNYTIPLLLLYTTTNILAQTASGVYITVDDFRNNKIAEEIECKKNSKETFKKHDLFAKANFVVINKGVKTTYLKKDIYAYRDCANRVWRFYNNHEYEILETKNVYVYALEKIVMSGIAVEKEPVYYFSTDAKGEIKKLTLSNLKAAYPDNQALYTSLDTYIKANQYIKSFDSGHNTDIVTYLSTEAVK